MIKKHIFRLGPLLIAALLLLVSCERHGTDEKFTLESKNKYIQVSNALRQFFGKLGIAIVEKSLSASNILEHIKFELLSTNIATRELHSACDVVWVNDDPNYWRNYMDGGNNPISAPALVVQFEVESTNRFMGFLFDGQITKMDGPPTSGFTKLNISAMNPSQTKESLPASH